MSCNCNCNQTPTSLIVQTRAIALERAIASLSDTDDGLQSDQVVERAEKFAQFLMSGNKSE